MKEKIILGIDPGTNILGYGAIVVSGNSIQMKDVGILHLKKIDDAHEKLSLIYKQVNTLIKELNPEAMAIESPFFGKNVQSMLKLGRAQGVAIAAAVELKVPVVEYSPKKIKMSICGNGNASKEQVSAMICRLLKLNDVPAFFDETDALATAVCFALQGIAHKTTIKKSDNSWSNYLKENPKKMIK